MIMILTHNIYARRNSLKRSSRRILVRWNYLKRADIDEFKIHVTGYTQGPIRSRRSFAGDS